MSLAFHPLANVTLLSLQLPSNLLEELLTMDDWGYSVNQFAQKVYSQDFSTTTYYPPPFQRRQR